MTAQELIDYLKTLNSETVVYVPEVYSLFGDDENGTKYVPLNVLLMCGNQERLYLGEVV
jgi:hypothetical protein